MSKKASPFPPRPVAFVREGLSISICDALETHHIIIKRFALQFQAFEADIITLRRIVTDERAYRRITDAETQNILVANEDGRGGHKSSLLESNQNKSECVPVSIRIKRS